MSEQQRCPSCQMLGPHGPFTDWHTEGDANCQTISALRAEVERLRDRNIAIVDKCGHDLAVTESENERLRHALDTIRDYIESGREAGEPSSVREQSIYDTARRALGSTNE